MASSNDYHISAVLSSHALFPLAYESSLADNSDLIACTVAWKDGQKIRRFLVIDVMQLILVEPDTKRLGWGVAKLVGFLQDIEVTGDKDDSRCLHITIHRPLSSNTASRVPLLSAKFIFDDNIRLSFNSYIQIIYIITYGVS